MIVLPLPIYKGCRDTAVRQAQRSIDRNSKVLAIIQDECCTFLWTFVYKMLRGCSMPQSILTSIE